MNNILGTSKRVIIYEEISDHSIDVSDNDIKEYSERLGIDLAVNPTLATSVRDWILQPLPRYWFPCLDTQTGLWFYSNTLNGQSTWTHPLEEIHKNLAKEYCNSQNISDLERENPEGESAEQSMESGFSSKTFGSLSPPIAGGIPPIRSQLPRALAPLKRIPKPEPLSTLKTQVNPLPPFSVTSPLNNEQVREVSFSTFKSANPIQSLLPSDILFDNRDRPATSLAPFNHSVLSSTEGVWSKNSSKETDQFLAPNEVDNLPRNLLSGKKHIAPLTVDSSTKKEIAASPESTESTAHQSKPAARISFTERLAAKKASRSKSNENLLEPTLNPTESDQTSAINVEKKHVQFDLETKQICHYTPECSEEIKVADKSESSSSDDILDLAGDPEFLEPLSNLNCYPTTFEEKRWDVSFTSFGVDNLSPEIVSPGVVDTEDSHEMVTRFNSEYCPSPLPASSIVKNHEDHITIESTAVSTSPIQNQAEVEIESAVKESNSYHLSDDNLPVIEMNVPIIQDIAQEELTEQQTFFIPFDEDDNSKKNEVILEEFAAKGASPPPPIEDSIIHVEEEKHSLSISVSNSPIPEIAIEKEIQLSISPVKSRVPKLIRSSSSRSDSFEIVIQSPPVNVQDLPPTIDPVESTDFCYSKSIESHNPIDESDDDFCTKPQAASQLDLLLPPASFSQNDYVSQAITLVQKEVKKPNLLHNDDTMDAHDSIGKQMIPSLEDWQNMKKEMESTLENEKKKLENWFSSEIAQIKKQFESELASERQRTENLSRLVESTKSEKEELARREIIRLEESLAHLVEEKTRQVQTRLNNEILQDNSLLNRPVDRQDANVQTEEPAIPVHTARHQRTRSSSLDETETSESNRARTESRSRCESRESRKRDTRIKCQCDSLQKQVARVEREMQLLKQKNLSFQKNPPTRKKSTPVKAQREPWWLDTDESTTSTVSSIPDWRHSRSKSHSMTNLQEGKNVTSRKKSDPIQRARDLLAKSQTPRKAWMEDLSTDSSGDTPTSGVSSAISTCEWDTVLSSIQKISGDLQEVWSHIGPRPKPLSYLSHTTRSVWMPTTSSYSSDRVPLHWSFTGSTAERTQALRLWLQQNKIQHSRPFL